MGSTIVLATANPGKVKELSEPLGALGYQIVTQSQWEIQPIAETGQTFIENALLKARHCAQQSGLPALADDSGLVVEALQGAPGIYSARYAGEHASEADNRHKLLEQLQQVPAAQRTAHFYCVIVYLRYADDPAPLISQAHWQGAIALHPSGDQGFGYDSLFYLPDRHCTAAALSREQKFQHSHRGQALRQLLTVLPHA
ncbi:RdgB/HAM1 family non-canonical purine NTP pyrophosphatase [unidentified bacterial endosymbiont]|uniref:RdgB/HAM1 family non-canonical purine NTP pyrophosphatase n=1 Tax=unidentified bacterial endosymbiont TaxID=2355 RepID=UPI00209CE69F|nr:RdgB/HAM1 family non-canonical purine NTP pyrophosphatase [unidentified bacterial endosymbiont]